MSFEQIACGLVNEIGHFVPLSHCVFFDSFPFNYGGPFALTRSFSLSSAGPAFLLLSLYLCQVLNECVLTFLGLIPYVSFGCKSTM